MNSQEIINLENEIALLKAQLPKGEIFINFQDLEGNFKEVYYENLIMNDFGIFLARCCENPQALNSGIMWLALGSGDGSPTWDTTPPAPAVNLHSLYNETCRKRRTDTPNTPLPIPTNIVGSGIVYKTEGSPTVAAPAGTYSRIIDISWTFDFGEANSSSIGAIRELCMYVNSSLPLTPTYYSGANIAIINADPEQKGIMVNKKHFPAINKTSQWQMNVVYRITFGG